MQTFMDWLKENIFRIDKDKINDFSTNLQTYYRNADWSRSGNKPKPDMHKEIGLFGGELRDVVPYAVPRNVKWIIIKNKRPSIFFNQQDKPLIINYKPHLSQFQQDKFTQVQSGEYFSNNPGTAIRQELIRNPLRLIKKWYDVHFVTDVEELAKQLRNNNIEFDSEGLD